MKGFCRTHSTLFRLFLAALPVVFLAFCTLATQAERVDDLPKPTDYVSDYAHVLSPEAIARLDRICVQLDKSQANAQIAVVTVKSLDGADSADYASELETKWKMGKKGSDRGVLVLLAVDDHKRRIDVGYGLEGILNDAKLGDIGREMVPYLKGNDFDSAVTLAVGEMAQVIATDAKVTLSDEAGQTQALRQPVRRAPSLGRAILLIVLLIFFGGFFLLRFLMSFGLLGMFMGGRGGPWMGGGGFGGGGFGGGGDSGGGGFGGFGGGDFGGGGAGGDW